jgi:acetoin utilization deacetylase AcuC-like enzyme
MHTFFYPDHIHHQPERLHRADSPHNNSYYAEVSARGATIHNALQAARIGDILPPQDYGLDPIAAIHHYDMLEFLQTAYERLAKESTLPVAIPETFNLRAQSRHKPLNVVGQLGYFCFDTSSPIFEHTWQAAYWSAQTAVNAAALVLQEKHRFAYALCRPPGHHAAHDMYGGFCYLNNAAIAANWLIEQGQRVAILDVDFHHGNGTQQIFYGRSDLLFCSIHADPLVEYPFYWGYADEFGEGLGRNLNFNYPLPLGATEPTYMSALDEALNKIRTYVPDTLILSFGADTLANDPVGGFLLEVDSYGRMGQKIAALNLPTIIVQEGGYLLTQLGDCVVALLQGMETSA